jgi:hypothetical protein
LHELPQLRREASWNHDLAQPKVPPGSAEELIALAQLDAARAQEERELADTPADRARRLKRHWRRQSTRS